MLGHSIYCEIGTGELMSQRCHQFLYLYTDMFTDIVDGQQLLKDMANMTVYNRSAGDRQVSQ